MANNVELTREEIEHHNLSATHLSDSADTYICVACKRRVSWEDSYSDKKRNLHCTQCVEKLAKQHNMSTTSYLLDHIWNT